MKQEIRLKSVGELDSAALKRCAELILDSLPSFYNLLPGTANQQVLLIQQSMIDPRSDLHGMQAVYAGDALLGMFVAYPSEEIDQQNFMGAMVLCETMTAEAKSTFFARLEKYAGGIPEIKPGSYYLARFAVVPELRGTEASQKVLHAYIGAGAEFGCYSMHVESKNVRAKGFYKKNNFEISGRQDLPFIIMTASNEVI